MKKNILILGGTGFIGSYLSQYLSKKFNVFSTSTSGLKTTHKYLINDNKSLKEIVITNKIEILINTIVSYSNDFEACFDLNTAGINNIMNQINKNIHFINISSVFADNKNKYANTYSLSKSFGDDIIQYYFQENSKITNLRFAQIFDIDGIAQKSQKGFYYFINSIKNNQSINLFGDPNSMRSYIPVEIVCESVEYSILENIYGFHNVIMPDKYSNFELIKLLSSYCNYDLNKIVNDSSKNIAEYFIPNCSTIFESFLEKKNCTSYFRQLIEK